VAQLGFLLEPNLANARGLTGNARDALQLVRRSGDCVAFFLALRKESESPTSCASVSPI
jgi:hypothetical protein